MTSTVYQTVTDRIIAELEKGAAPWIKPWRVDNSADRNMVSQKPYQGINRLILGMEGMANGYSTPIWATFKQWKELGAHVRKGEKGTSIVFYSPVSKTNDEGETETYRLLKTFYVFNVQQVDGIDIPAPTTNDGEFNAIETAEARISKTGAIIRHGGDAAFYVPSRDAIQMPHKTAFDDEASYYATLFHELTHWTGAKHRLDRNLEKTRFGNPAYAFEELVAEMGAAFLCQDHGIQGELRHAGYIASWLKALRDDSRAIFKAAALAQQAADCLNACDYQQQAVA